MAHSEQKMRYSSAPIIRSAVDLCGLLAIEIQE